MSGLKAGDRFPEDVAFNYIPWTPENASLISCGKPQVYQTASAFAGKKAVLISTPGAFTPGCTQRHLPGFISNLTALKAKGVDTVAVIAYNDAWVMSAWGKAYGIEGDDIVFLSDPEARFSRSIGWASGTRGARYALVVDDGVVTYAGKEEGAGEIVASSVETILAKL
ncbi:MAG: hypothetical protein M1839_006842 [Geoglossum umbratile]|nr:MAG: hypothetical protein M1839_006842 [Geoglossum umbratile]